MKRGSQGWTGWRGNSLAPRRVALAQSERWRGGDSGATHGRSHLRGEVTSVMREYDFPIEGFGPGTPRELEAGQMVHRERVVTGELVKCFQRRRVPSAAQHLQGCGRR